ncbi:hypothetical membrane protein [Pelotomaculum thermopropionicum SI]|uniref:Hypothetical membrane protein n=1 Tax=Pelotomaculum thermopropionicum (strain DSM 13744 / JCM 10971 / SI) TaxID=370438 RepID=A5D579_PELTS|nr:hypothetical membrane protein [Pelotomaculum thermopropionicum SI]
MLSKACVDPEAVEDFRDEMEQAGRALPDRVGADPDKVEQGLAKLVLTIIQLLIRLLEKQAIRRIDRGGLSSEEIDRMGITFMKLENKMEELKKAFGLEGEELNLNLGPLGDLM